jgi:4-hydroxybenzoate polyprenyltransferase
VTANFGEGQLESPTAALPLCVDLDGTLIVTDSLHEALAVSSRDPLSFARLFATLRRGKAAFKQQAYALAGLDAESLPYNPQLIDYLREQKSRGRHVYLVTAADELLATAVAERIGLFDGVISSDGIANLRGEAKADALVERFGRQGFCYAGNDHTDLAVWRVAASAVLVGAPASVAARVRKSLGVEAEFAHPRSGLRSLVKAMRPHQWAKNILVFLPIITSTQLLDRTAWERAGVLFASFCLVASSIYILNDLVDLKADRSHPRKRQRPFASGALSVKRGLQLSFLLAAAGLAIAAPVQGVLLVAAYAALSASYSFILKERPLLDVFALASLYTIRLFAGGQVSGHAVTEWLAGFSTFVFLSLALAKRVAELLGTRARAGGHLSRRGYTDEDIPLLEMMGIASAFVASLVLGLYLQSQTAQQLYAHPQWLFAIVLAVLFWICRVWMKTARGAMHDDPVVWAIRDRVSLVLGAAIAAAFVLAVGKV